MFTSLSWDKTLLLTVMEFGAISRQHVFRIVDLDHAGGKK